MIDMESNDFVDYGVRLFKEGTAEDNEKRRTARSRRRLLSRRHTRIEDMKKLHPTMDDRLFDLRQKLLDFAGEAVCFLQAVPEITEGRTDR